MTDNRITLAGAGLVGSLLAVFLAKRGYQVGIFERRPDMRRTDISAGRSINLALANRGIRALEAVGLMEEVNKLLLPMRGRMVHDLQGNSNFQAYGQKPHEVIYSVSRAELNKLMLNAAEQSGRVKIHFEHQVTGLDLDSNRLSVSGPDGQSREHPFNRIIGTDGAGSAVREALMAKAGRYNKEEPLGHCYKELCIPPGPNGSFQIAKDALHIWPRGGFMLIALPNLDGSFTVTLFMPNQGDISFGSIDTADKLDSFFSTYFADLKALIPNLQQEYFDNPTSRLATVRCAPWHYQDKALLLGDAAHAVVPFHGQGMNCGFEDALDFSKVLDEEQDWARIFEKTENLRFANGNAIADMAIENYLEMRDSVLQSDYLLKKQIAFKLEQWFPERFTPRYAMVMFHHLPYAEAQRLGEIHKKILAQLAEGVSSAEQLDKTQAESVLASAGL
ncbi:NAD(P)/FAD-dependent oxidoreductase [Aliiglaciecola sp. CAU 1673]|uniref:FAD-dependent oxidoreductase n=1 Tax=Aliiglaciecola sp. CAU 1673 TaxID=3032595 RepID=UPI0023DBB89B|nr:NAD(P)/FAD-dependent oxidoreductase [Aliiglaciecola sp. CAU 1673]MDF2176811.1 NAD(P)/FAD-dependent oxidoreductase [Aliiglaciecola sp. CAU 1673]